VLPGPQDRGWIQPGGAGGGQRAQSMRHFVLEAVHETLQRHGSEIPG
jgi:hypothetical protein